MADVKEEKKITASELAQQEFNEVQSRVNEFLKNLAEEGFGLDANFQVSRQGIIPNIFVVRIK